MRSLLVRWLINTLALYVAIRWMPGIRYEGGPLELLALAALFGVVNSTVRPILTLLTCPLVLLTLGFFTLVINALLLLLTAWLSDGLALGFYVDGFWPAFWAGLVISIVSLLLSLLVGEHKVRVTRIPE